MMPEKRVTVVILNYNGIRFLEQFLPGVIAHATHETHILVADNASTDGSADFVRNRFPQVECVAFDNNTGFTGGNNRAMNFVKTEFAILLNSDVEVTEGWIPPLLHAMDIHADWAIAQPKLRDFWNRDRFEYAGGSGGYMDSLYYPCCRGRLFDQCETDQGQYDDEREIFWATGACCIVRMAVVHELGLFTERFFAHWEEIDFCWRIQNKGFKAGAVPSSVVYHVGGGTLSRQNAQKTFLNIRNSLQTIMINAPDGERWIKIFLRLVLDGIFGIKMLLEPAHTLAIAKAHIAFYKTIGACQRQRKSLYPGGLQKHTEQGRIHGSIVWGFFARGKKRFSDYRS